MASFRDAATTAIMISWFCGGFTVARTLYSAKVIRKPWLVDDTLQDGTWLSLILRGSYASVLSPFEDSTARNGRIDIMVWYLMGASSTFIFSGYLFEISSPRWELNCNVFKKVLANTASVGFSMLLVALPVAALGPGPHGQCLMLGEGGTLLILFVMLMLGPVPILYVAQRVQKMYNEPSPAETPLLSAPEGSLEDTSEQAMSLRMHDFRDQIQSKTKEATEAHEENRSTEMAEQMLKLRGSLLMERHWALSLENSRVLTLNSLWRDRTEHSEMSWCLTHLPRCLMCLAFWFHCTMLAVQLILMPVLAWSTDWYDTGCIGFNLYLWVSLGVSLVVYLFVHWHLDKLRQWVLAQVRKFKEYEWTEATAGFEGTRKMCVVSMSGLDQEFWFGVKDACKDMSISFACLWEEDWGSLWWTRWKQNVQNFAMQEDITAIVLVNPILTREGATQDQKELLLGNAQQIEVSYMFTQNMEKRLKFYTNARFATMLKEMREGTRPDDGSLPA